MKTNHISPLTLFIMKQACSSVKEKGASLGLDFASSSSQTGLEPLMEAKMFLDIPWAQLMSHDLEIPCSYHPRSFGDTDASSGVLRVSCSSALSALDRSLNPVVATVLSCDLCHDACFQVVNNIKERGVDVWIECSLEHPQQSEIFFEDHKLQRSAQLGFSWYFNAPSVDEFTTLFELSLPAWRFWFKNEQSCQWVWPFCDIIYQRLCEEYNLSSPPKPWIKDLRQRSSWSKLEDRVFSYFVAVMGGEAVVSAMMRKALTLSFSSGSSAP